METSLPFLSAADTGRYMWKVLARESYSAAELDALSQLQTRIVRCCQLIWEAVRHILCDDSPEGHLPEEMEEIEGLDTKDLLRFAFRATIESR